MGQGCALLRAETTTAPVRWFRRRSSPKNAEGGITTRHTWRDGACNVCMAVVLLLNYYFLG